LLLFSVRVLRGYRRFHFSSKQKTLSRLASLRGLVKKRRRRRRRRRRCACIQTHTHNNNNNNKAKEKRQEPTVRTSTAEAKKRGKIKIIAQTPARRTSSGKLVPESWQASGMLLSTSRTSTATTTTNHLVTIARFWPSFPFHP